MVIICSPLFFPFMICYIAVEQMLVHFYTERMLFLRLCLWETIKSVEGSLLAMNWIACFNAEEVKLVSTCEQKVTFCDEELPNLAAGQDRYNRFFCIVNFYILNPTIVRTCYAWASLLLSFLSFLIYFKSSDFRYYLQPSPVKFKNFAPSKSAIDDARKIQASKTQLERSY